MQVPPKTKKCLDFSSSGTWTNPGGVQAVFVTLVGAAVGNSSSGDHVAGDTSAGALIAHGGRGSRTAGLFDAITNPSVIQGWVDVSGGNLSVSIGSGASGGSNGSATVQWEE